MLPLLVQDFPASVLPLSVQRFHWSERLSFPKPDLPAPNHRFPLLRLRVQYCPFPLLHLPVQYCPFALLHLPVLHHQPALSFLPVLHHQPALSFLPAQHHQPSLPLLPVAFHQFLLLFLPVLHRQFHLCLLLLSAHHSYDAVHLYLEHLMLFHSFHRTVPEAS